MLRDIQDQLTELYRVETGYCIDEFLITDPQLARLLGRESMLPGTDESVLLSEDEHGLALSVFLDEQLLKRLQAGDPLAALRPELLDDLWIVIEGVSHFTYLAWNAQRDRPVTLLELELQAEIDKFVSTWLMALRQQDDVLADRLHGWLFDDVRFRPQLDGDQRERYRAANDYAGRFCHGLVRRLKAAGDTALEELRDFYRLTQTHKIAHIHSQAFASA